MDRCRATPPPSSRPTSTRSRSRSCPSWCCIRPTIRSGCGSWARGSTTASSHRRSGRSPGPAVRPWPGMCWSTRDLVAGRRVLDLASGSGLVAIAAARAGAASVRAVDIDPLAMAAIELNAATNRVTVTAELADILDAGSADADVVLAGDVFYSAAMAARVYGVPAARGPRRRAGARRRPGPRVPAPRPAPATGHYGRSRAARAGEHARQADVDLGGPAAQDLGLTERALSEPRPGPGGAATARSAARRPARAAHSPTDRPPGPGGPPDRSAHRTPAGCRRTTRPGTWPRPRATPRATARRCAWPRPADRGRPGSTTGTRPRVGAVNEACSSTSRTPARTRTSVIRSEAIA